MGPRKAVRIHKYGNLRTSLINLILYNSSSRQSLSITAVAADLVLYMYSNYGSSPLQIGAGLATERDQIQLGLNLRDAPHVAGHHSARENPRATTRGM